MTMTSSKNLSIDKRNSHEYSEKTLNGLSNSFDTSMVHWTVGPREGAAQNNTENIKFLGRTTPAINGVSGIKGFVASALHEPSGQMVAVKRYKLEEEKEENYLCQNSQEKFNENITFIMQEVIRMRQIRHPNILPALSSFVSNSDICIVSPIMKMGSARDVLNTHFPGGLPENIITIILRDVLSALVHLHSKSIIHRSIRASHILLDPNTPVAKLTGLRYACNLQDPPGQGLQERYDYPLHVVTTNLNWLSPEILQQNLCGYNEKSDIYSLAVTACEMANGLVPFSEMPGTLMLLEKLRGAAPKLLDKSTFDIDGPDNLCDAATENERINESRKVENEGHHQEQNTESNEKAGLPTDQKPGDSGVGVSVGSTNNMAGGISSHLSQVGTMQALSSRASLYANREFSDTFHDFVSDSSILEPSERPSAYELLNSHQFIRQCVKKIGGEKAKSHVESIISSFWSSMKDKEQQNNSKPKNITQENSYNFECAPQQSSTNYINDIEWIF